MALLLLWPAAAATAQDSNALAATIMRHLAALPDRRAAFTDTKTLSSLAAPVRSGGTLVFRHPDHLEKLTAWPKPERLVIEGGTLTLSGASGAARTVALDTHPALRLLATTLTATLGGDFPALQRLFVVGAAGTLASWRMVLRPADPALGRFIASVTIDGARDDLRTLHIVQADGDTETMQVQPAP